MDHASVHLSSVAHVPQHGKDETFLVTYVSHSDSIELVNLGFLSFFHPSCPSRPKRVQFSSCWQHLSDADLCHKGTCMHACMQQHTVSPCAQPVFQRPKHRVISNCQVLSHWEFQGLKKTETSLPRCPKLQLIRVRSGPGRCMCRVATSVRVAMGSYLWVRRPVKRHCHGGQ